jgi:hypothetical protein
MKFDVFVSWPHILNMIRKKTFLCSYIKVSVFRLVVTKKYGSNLITSTACNYKLSIRHPRCHSGWPGRRCDDAPGENEQLGEHH